ncbi:MAG: cob(I)yrinic acid a,c-diamide adenosyltransferase [Paludibacter sp.]|nr:cob(I)yrinic acid a,c-diamide adenosyltransferase [Paludibacter sp.]
MKLYTKTGDKGQTGLIGGTRVAKNDVRLDAYGTVDELNSFIGLLTTYAIPEEDIAFLRKIQNLLFSVGSHLATDTSKVAFHSASVLVETDIECIEHEIDRLDAALPPLSSFILPGGSPSGALGHVCRTVARRAERRMFDMNQYYPVDNYIFIYINRLSDYFFVLSRHLTLFDNGKEICWKK